MTSAERPPMKRIAEEAGLGLNLWLCLKRLEAVFSKLPLSLLLGEWSGRRVCGARVNSPVTGVEGRASAVRSADKLAFGGRCGTSVPLVLWLVGLPPLCKTPACRSQH